jgi:hypothetical protein
MSVPQHASFRGIIIFQFELNESVLGEIEPEFVNILSETPDSLQTDLDDLISTNDRFRLFFNHTTGMTMKRRGRSIKNFIIGRLKESPYKILSYYYKTESEAQFLSIALFNKDVEVEVYESIFYQLTEHLASSFEKIGAGNIRNVQALSDIERSMKNDLKYAIFQIERLTNLSKLQKVGLIFSSFPRMELLRMLREGPIARSQLNEKIQEIKSNSNLDILLKPFIELNLIRRDWVHGVLDKNTGRIQAQGEYIFLVKDITLIRKPPSLLLAEMKHNKLIGTHYQDYIQKYYTEYNPFVDLAKESESLSKFLLDPDVFDFLALLKTRAYPLKKLPNVLSSFSDINDVLAKLIESKIITIIKDSLDMKWICLIAEIYPMIIFPEYLINKISDRSSMSLGAFSEESLVAPITKEVGQIALDLLESTYQEIIEF